MGKKKAKQQTLSCVHMGTQHAFKVTKEMAQIKILLKYKTLTEVAANDLVSVYRERRFGRSMYVWKY